MTTVAPRSCLYAGTVVHQRFRPRRYRLAHRLFWIHVDLDELAELDRGLRLFSLDRWNLVGLSLRDHGARDGSPLRSWVMARLAEAQIELARPRITLLCMPRLLGYVFNPISLYYVHDGDRLRAVVCEVKNTFGAQTAYVVPITAAATADPRPTCAKRMYVSPFIAMDATYRFTFKTPGERFLVVIHESQGELPILLATQLGRRLALTDRTLLALALRNLLMTFKVTAAIHLHAARLWLRGVSYVPPPAAGTEIPASTTGEGGGRR